MTDLDKSKIKILEEYSYFVEEKNIEFGKDLDLLAEVLSTESLNGLEKVRGALNNNACVALLERCKEVIGYYSKISTNIDMITKYDEELFEYSEEVEAVNNKTAIKDYTQYKTIFEKLWAFNKKLAHHNNNLLAQFNSRLIGTLFPSWAATLTIIYGIIMTLVFSNSASVPWLYIVGGWLLLVIVLWLVIKLTYFFYKRKF